MKYKLQKILKDNKVNLIVCAMVWLITDILIIAPLAVSTSNSLVNGKFDINLFFDQFMIEFTTFTAFTRIFHFGTFGIFIKATFWLTILILVLFIISVIKAKPKNEYTDIEHGSSDWSEGGEQYKILSKKKGIVLAENNYLPVNKVGNVNVMVIGRFWFW